MKISNFLFLLAILALVSCKKTEETITKPDAFNANSNVSAATDNSIANLMFEEVYK